jgi:LPS export ABC transporter protein LptC
MTIGGMKWRFLLLFVLGTLLAAGTGWLIDLQRAVKPRQALQAPDNIDYYMKQVDYRAFDENGLLSYHLRSPYLEHFIREDSSHLQTPKIDFFAAEDQWHARSNQAVLSHAEETLTFNDKVDLRRSGGTEPLNLTSDKLILYSREERMEVPVDMILLQGGLTLHATGAILDMKSKRHNFTGVKAVYHAKQDTAG